MNYTCDPSRFMECTESKLRKTIFSFLSSKVLPTVLALMSKMTMSPQNVLFYIKISGTELYFKVMLPNKISITHMVNIIKTLNNFQKGASYQKTISKSINFFLLPFKD